TGDQLGEIEVVAETPLPPDAPPPKPLVRGRDLVVVGYVRDGSAARKLNVATYRDQKIAAQVLYPESPDDSFAYDAALGAAEGGLVAWDETAGRRGIVKVAAVPTEVAPDQVPRGVIALLGAGPAMQIVSPVTSDADQPRLVARTGGYWIAWVARQ